jgi:hypothetical protein
MGERTTPFPRTSSSAAAVLRVHEEQDTSVALVMAMPMATGKFKNPKLCVATSTVTIVNTITAPKIE